MSQINTDESQPGIYNPNLSDINFVVSDTKPFRHSLHMARLLVK